MIDSDTKAVVSVVVAVWRFAANVGREAGIAVAFVGLPHPFVFLRRSIVE